MGRGCLAGPVVAAGVILDFAKLELLPEKRRNLIRDSKTLSATQRQNILDDIYECTTDMAIGFADVSEIDSMGILNAAFLAMKRALSIIEKPYSIVLVDGHIPIRGVTTPQRAVIKGDHWCYSIAAAAIIAKEARDSLMRDMGAKYPGYGFERHVGYGTKDHLDGLRSLGITPLHRRSFAPIRTMVHASTTSTGI